ncbi:MAG: PD40 domain-containing protein, partial [Flavobacteriales bacterium]|nr:PD40 domain-containing protein [Flavobacteriales bacterium]
MKYLTASVLTASSLFLVLLCTNVSTFGQDGKAFETKFIMGGGEPELLEEAEWFMGALDYNRALPIYVKLDIRYPGVPEYKFLAGICYLHKYDEQEKAIPYFEKAYKQKPDMKDIEYALGKAYFVNYRFEEAIKHLKLSQVEKATSAMFIDEVAILIQNSKNGIKLMEEYDESWYKLKNMGAPVNTKFDEYVPLVSVDESSIIYTYKGKRSMGGMRNMYGEPDPEGEYFEDIFSSTKAGDDWLDPDAVGGLLNSSWHDAAIAASIDGQRLFVYKDLKGGDIYVTKLKRKNWAEPVRLEGDINTKHWEGHASIAVDGKTIYFSSDRPGGFGGKDLYKASLKDGDQWGDVENLGDNVNTEFDDDAPFIHANGELLYFSSKGHNSMGGYDVFFSKLEKKKWGKPSNIGHPVNTPNDDLYYVVTPSGKKAYFSSARKG